MKHLKACTCRRELKVLVVLLQGTSAGLVVGFEPASLSLPSHTCICVSSKPGFCRGLPVAMALFSVIPPAIRG